MANSTKNNKKNNLNHNIRSVDINKLGILYGCICINVNEYK